MKDYDINHLMSDNSNILHIKDHHVFLQGIESKPIVTLGLLTYLEHPESGIKYKQIFLIGIEQAAHLCELISGHLQYLGEMNDT